VRLDIIMARVTKIGTSSQIFIFFGTRSSGVRSSPRRIENRDGIDSDVLLDQMRDLKPRRLALRANISETLPVVVINEQGDRAGKSVEVGKPVWK